YEKHQEALTAILFERTRISSFRHSFHNSEEYDYYNIKPTIGKHAIEIRKSSGERELLIEFEEFFNDQNVLVYRPGRATAYWVFEVLDLAWHRTFTVYNRLKIVDLIRGLSLRTKGRRSFNGRIGGGINKGELVKVGDAEYRLIGWKRRSMKKMTLPTVVEGKIRSRAKKISVTNGKYVKL
ncbi:MAG: hypothetical protein AAFY76_06890, partial [Cyanobacteria bacterium J06649_11]